MKGHFSSFQLIVGFCFNIFKRGGIPNLESFLYEKLEAIFPISVFVVASRSPLTAAWYSILVSILTLKFLFLPN